MTFQKKDLETNFLHYQKKNDLDEKKNSIKAVIYYYCDYKYVCMNKNQ